MDSSAAKHLFILRSRHQRQRQLVRPLPGGQVQAASLSVGNSKLVRGGYRSPARPDLPASSSDLSRSKRMALSTSWLHCDRLCRDLFSPRAMARHGYHLPGQILLHILPLLVHQVEQDIPSISDSLDLACSRGAARGVSIWFRRIRLPLGVHDLFRRVQ